MTDSPTETAKKHRQGLHGDTPNVNCIDCAKGMFARYMTEENRIRDGIVASPFSGTIEAHDTLTGVHRMFVWVPGDDVTPPPNDEHQPDPVRRILPDTVWPKRPDTDEPVVWDHGKAIPLDEWNAMHPGSYIGTKGNPVTFPPIGLDSAHEGDLFVGDPGPVLDVDGMKPEHGTDCRCEFCVHVTQDATFGEAVNQAWKDHLTGPRPPGNTANDNQYEAVITGFNHGMKFAQKYEYDRGRKDERADILAQWSADGAMPSVQHTAAAIILQKRLDERDAEIVRLKADENARHNALAQALADGQKGVTLQDNVDRAYGRALADLELVDGEDRHMPIILDRLMTALGEALE